MMADKSNIRQIVSLASPGVFANYKASPDAPEFKKHNLIYGFNGSGKTTLSRVFASLQDGRVRPELAEGAEFSVELNDGSMIKSLGTLNGMTERILVFNVDFIQENLRWSEGTANPIFYIGKDQADLSKRLEKVEADIAELEPKLNEAERARSRSEKAFGDHKRDRARSIEGQLGLSRTYTAVTLASDYEKGTYEENLKLSDTEQTEQRSIISQDSPIPKCASFDEATFSLESFVRDTQSLLSKTLGTETLKDLQQHPNMLKWVRDGLDYHLEHDVELCLLCGGPLTQERVASLGKVINQKFEQLTNDISYAVTEAEQLRERIANAKAAIPSSNDISKTLRLGFIAASDNVRAALNRADAVVNVALGLLHRKSNAPNLAVETTKLPETRDATEWDKTAAHHFAELNSVIAQHNTIHDQFSDAQAAARATLKKHLLADGQARYLELEEEHRNARSAIEDLKVKHKKLVAQANDIKQHLRQHAPAAEQIQRMVHSYLGHGELKIDSSDTGYEITRHGVSVNGTLSEGEKTAIALCYFLSTLEAEGRKLKDLIVVVDDPISSLDTRALHYAFCMIKGTLNDAGQLILMTHNLHFMNEVKRWLKRRAGKGTAALLFLDAVQAPGGGIRSATIRELPRLIREYQSEYQYLFHLTLQFVHQSPDDRWQHFYMMPNVLRKVLDVFLSFKLPGSAGLANKIEHIVDADYGLDPARVHALDRLTQLESHADSLDDLVTFSSMTIEETVAAAEALLHLIETVDEVHFKNMCRICGS